MSTLSKICEKFKKNKSYSFIHTAHLTKRGRLRVQEKGSRYSTSRECLLLVSQAAQSDRWWDWGYKKAQSARATASVLWLQRSWYHISLAYFRHCDLPSAIRTSKLSSLWLSRERIVCCRRIALRAIYSLRLRYVQWIFIIIVAWINCLWIFFFMSIYLSLYLFIPIYICLLDRYTNDFFFNINLFIIIPFYADLYAD